MVYGDANNMNQYHIIGQESYQSGIIDHYGKEQYGSFAWQHNGQTKGAEDVNYISVNPDFGHQDGSGSTQSSTQQFFPGEQQTFTLSKTDNGSLTWQKLYAYLTRTSLAETPQLNGEKYSTCTVGN